LHADKGYDLSELRAARIIDRIARRGLKAGAI
jgi:hypothetical protein